MLAKIRSGTLCLAVKTGQFCSIPVQNRLCGRFYMPVFICQLLLDLALLNISLQIKDLFIKIMSTEKVYSLANYVEKALYYQRTTCLIYNI